MKVEMITKSIGLGKYSELDNEAILSAIARHGTIKNDSGKLVKYLLDNKHYSPLDMINFGFEVETSRAIGRQIIRHASIKFQEHSQRYSDRVLFEDVEIRKEHPTNRQSSTEIFDPIVRVVPEQIVDRSIMEGRAFKASERIQFIKDVCTMVYNELTDAGVAKECARMILPECTTSTLSANGSLRSWLSFLNVRCDEHAQKECQEIATLIGEKLEKELVNVFSNIDWRNGMFM